MFNAYDIVNEQEYNYRVSTGYKRMQELSVVFCALARNCGNVLENTLSSIDNLGKKFKDYKVVIIENDSTDNTKEILKKWPSVKAFCYDFKLPFFRGGTRSIFRVFMLANIRSMYLNYIDIKYPNVDYVIVLDLDIQIENNGIAHTFSFEDFDGIAANGRDINLRYIVYDAYSYMDESDYENPYILPQKRISNNTAKLSALKIGEPLHRCLSAFSGLCVYNRKSIYGLRYSVPMIHYTEHTGLHESMRLRGHDRFYVNPSMVVYRT